MSLNSKWLIPLSFLIVALGSPSLSGPLSMAASAFGYALFWRATRSFWPAVIWFAGVQAVQWSWVTQTHYMGPFILVAYVLWMGALGFQFGWLTYLSKPPLTWMQIAGLSGLWTLIEWVRQFLLSGCFTWNPIGLGLAANDWSIQFASVVGIYGFCFWIIFTNLAALKSWRIWLGLALFPYLFGLCHQTYWEVAPQGGKKLSIALVQTAIRPEQRDRMSGKKSEHIPPLAQWARILQFFKAKGSAHYDLIVLPEGALPGGAKRLIYPLSGVKKLWSDFGNPSDFSLTEEPYVTNAFLLQGLAKHFDSEVIVGLDDDERGLVYNTAFHFLASGAVDRYQKQLLIPIGEYIPFKPLTKFFSEQFGLGGFFSAGSETKVFQGRLPMGISICLEETYGSLLRDSRRAGAELFVNITNDIWFPQTRLPWHHFDHARIRAAENGVYLIRSCNSGVTAVIDCFGRAESIFPVSEEAGGVLTAAIHPISHPTLYTFWGDFPVLFLSIGFYLFGAISRFQKKKLLGIRVLD